MTARFAPYSEGEANADLTYIHPLLRHLAVPIGEVLLDPANVNTHPPEQIEVLKSLLREFGQRLPFITRASTGVLEAGEGRVLAARALGWTHVAVLPCDDDAIQAMRFALADNRAPRLSVIDEDALAEQLLALHRQGSDVAVLGFDEDLALLLDGEADEAELPDPLHRRGLPAPQGPSLAGTGRGTAGSSRPAGSAACGPIATSDRPLRSDLGIQLLYAPDLAILGEDRLPPAKRLGGLGLLDEQIHARVGGILGIRLDFVRDDAAPDGEADMERLRRAGRVVAEGRGAVRAHASYLLPTTRAGDLIELGPHRLICGDSADPAVVAHLMGEELADLVWTDPPYGVAYVGKSEQLAAEHKTIANDNLGLDGTRDLVRRAAEAWPLRPGGAWYVCSPSGDMETAFRFGLVDAGRRLRQAIAWVKNAFVLGHFDYHYQHETILYGWAEGAGHYWCGSRSESSVWHVDKPTRAALHPTMKPIALVARGLKNSSQRGDVVFDGFGGSGSTLLAAHQLGRRARLVELSPGFCDVIVRQALELGLEAVVERPGVGRLAWGSESAGGA